MGKVSVDVKLFEDKWCVDKFCVSKLCVNSCGQETTGGGGGGGRDTEPKTRTPHKDVGNKVVSIKQHH